LFAFRLALHLGEKDPDAMLASMPASTFNEWMVYDQIEPFGEFRSELRHGQVMAMTANLHRNTANKPEPFTAFDFMNFIEPPPEPKLSDEEIEMAFKGIFGV
jgi:hypothetical protein